MDDVVLTIDTDWAPDCTIDFVAEQLIAHRVRTTWFLTHTSPAITRLAAHPELFELGIHPNFLSGSTHGETPDAVLRHCLAFVPEASSMRTHGLVQSTSLLRQIAAQSPITTDVSLFLPHTPHLRPVAYVWSDRTFLRVPYFWADDYEMEQRAPCWHLAPLLALGDGLKVFAFHPIHVYLNAPDIRPYQALKLRAPKLLEVSSQALDDHIQTGEGPFMLFTELIAHLESRGQSLCIRDFQGDWQDTRGDRHA
ncbi:MAG: hypothetical protein ACREQ7_03915 [Candidatus Binatia bacterium]